MPLVSGERWRVSAGDGTKRRGQHVCAACHSRPVVNWLRHHHQVCHQVLHIHPFA